ncbi:MAG: DUF3089 domain-containing protein [Aureispira sp.]
MCHLYGLFSFFLLFLLSSCSRESLLVVIKPPKKFAQERLAEAPNYALAKDWHEASRRFTKKKVDVFFVHPTTYIKARYWNQPLDHVHTNWRTRVLSSCYQTSAFYEDCNIFMPKYRQAAFYSFVDKKRNGEQALEVAYQDVKKAFAYYWAHHNNGRPFILAGHSQGSLHSQRLLAELMQDSVIRQQLVTAYAIGWPVTKQSIVDQPRLSVCSTATQTGCLISWNAQDSNAKTTIKDALKIQEEIVCVNPLSWTTDTNYVDRTYNKGALMPNLRLKKDEVLLHYTDAQIKGDLLLTTPNPSKQRLQMPLAKGNYHIYDYNFFYHNIKANIKTRIEAHKKQQKIPLTLGYY